MFRNKLKSALLALSALLVACGAVFAQEQKTPAPGAEAPQGRKVMKRKGEFGRQGRAGRHGGHRRDGLGGMLRQLNLTDAQQEQMRAIGENNRAQNAALHNEARQLMQQKRAGTLDANGQARLEQLHGQLKAQREAQHSQMLAVLTPEQKAQVEQFKKNHSLDLTDAQKQQMKSLRERYRQQDAATREEAHKLMQQKRAGTLDANGQARLEQLRGQFKAQREAQHNEFLNLLTPEQKAKLEQMRQNRRGGHRRMS